MATVPGARRRGAARVVLSAIARWADALDASRRYLQVERSNRAARRLYESAGFTELATYHYRVGARTGIDEVARAADLSAPPVAR